MSTEFSVRKDDRFEDKDHRVGYVPLRSRFTKLPVGG
jgi:hypothetical protein